MGAVLRRYCQSRAFSLGVTGYHIYHAAHGVGAVEHRPRAAQHLHFLHIFLIVEIGHMVGIYPCELRLSVNHHQHSAVVAYSTDFYAAGTTVIAYTETKYAALCYEEAWHHPGKR